MADIKIDIKHLAKLSKLMLREGEEEKLTEEMSGIVKMCEALPPSDGYLTPDESRKMELREDRVCPSFPRDELMASAPKTEAGCFVVPKTVAE